VNKWSFIRKSIIDFIDFDFLEIRFLSMRIVSLEKGQNHSNHSQECNYYVNHAVIMALFWPIFSWLAWTEINDAANDKLENSN